MESGFQKQQSSRRITVIFLDEVTLGRPSIAHLVFVGRIWYFHSSGEPPGPCFICSFIHVFIQQNGTESLLKRRALF